MADTQPPFDFRDIRSRVRESLRSRASGIPPSLAPVLVSMIDEHGDAFEAILGEFAEAIEGHELTVPVIVETAINVMSGLDSGICGVVAEPPIDPRDWLSPLLEVDLSATAEEFRAIRDRMNQPLAALGELFALHVPPNWPKARLIEILSLMTGYTPLPLVDVPDSETVQAFLDAHRRGDDVLAVLVFRRESILTSVESVLVMPSNDPTILAATSYLRDAVGALRGGWPRAALTASAVASDLMLRFLAGEPTTGSKQLLSSYRLEDVHNVPIVELRRKVVMHCATRIYAYWSPSGGGAEPGGFSRHLAVHALIHDEARIERDALWGTLLLANLLVVATRQVEP